MLIAKEKRKTNIAEYILYMWQVEDTIRACNFNMEILEDKIISQFDQPDKIQNEIRDWYANIMVMMHEENIKKSGHLKILRSLIDELFELHKKLIQDNHDPKYTDQYKLAAPNITDLSKKIGNPEANEIEVCLTGLYALLLLKLRKRKISEETIEAMQTFSKMLALLSEKYKEMEEGKFEI